MVVCGQEEIMIEKKDDQVLSNELPAHELSPSTIESRLAENQRHLQLTCCQLQSQIRTSFERLVDALRSREKQLLRQIDVLESQQMALLQSNQVNCTKGIPTPTANVHVDLCGEDALLESLVNFGRVEVEGCLPLSFDEGSAPYRIEEYENMKEDHVSLYKSLSQSARADDVIQFNVVPQLKSIPHSKSNEINLPLPEVSSQADVQRKNSLSGLECDPHTPHVQQWLQQIMVETETEPNVGEIEKQLGSLNNTK